MSKVGKTKQNWEGLICPVCRFVFRVPMDHTGAGVVCPACAHLLQIPSAEQRQMASNVRLSASMKASSKRHAVIKDSHLESVDNAATNEQVALGNHKQVLEEDDDGSADINRPDHLPAWELDAPAVEPISPLTWILSGSLLGVSIVLVGIWLIVQSVDEQKNAEIITDEQTELPIVESLPNSQKTQEAYMIEESKKVIKEFLKVESVSQLEGLVRTPAVTIPRMRAWYKNDIRKAPGLRVLGYKKSISVTGEVITMDVQLDDFSVKTISVVKTDNGYKIDWESWVAWSSVNWQELFDLRPNQPVEVRVQCKRVNYYNRLFSDSTKWFAVRLSHPDSEQSIYGYIDSEIPRFYRFITELVREKEVAATLKISYPINSPVGNQVTITEYLHSGWIREASPEAQSKQPAKR